MENIYIENGKREHLGSVLHTYMRKNKRITLFVLKRTKIGGRIPS